ncbi:MAG: amidohydrolase, partial [Deltaproteobacteria bacterium]|nr:amidohydrolase [Deltaproteobacteria bacterium]
MGKDLTALRHHLHAHPELSWKEIQTSAYIADELKSIGYENIKIGCNNLPVGVVAELDSGNPGPCVALRADMDALPLNEENNLPYRSQVEGVMHACGHDGHVAILLGTAKVLFEFKDHLKGRVRLVFQPAEEAGIPSGAEMMIKEGVMEGVEAIAGLHIWSKVPSGKLAFKSGPIMASVDGAKITVTGKGGHASKPHETVEPLVPASMIITAIQTIISREIDSQSSAVVAMCQINGGTAANIIPKTVSMTGNIRTFDRQTRMEIPKRMERIVTGICSAFDCEHNFDYTYLYPVTINDSTVTSIARKASLEMFDKDVVVEAASEMAAEDFSFFEEVVPGTYFFLGCGN